MTTDVIGPTAETQILTKPRIRTRALLEQIPEEEKAKVEVWDGVMEVGAEKDEAAVVAEAGVARNNSAAQWQTAPVDRECYAKVYLL